jgi:hypothetical protein
MAKKFDGTELNVSGTTVVAFTAAMSDDMRAFRDEYAQTKAFLADMPGHITAEVLRIIEPLNVQITEERVAGIAALEYIAGLESKTIMIESVVTGLVGSTTTPPGFAPTCGVCSPNTASTSPWGHTPAVVSGTPGQPGPSGANDPLGSMRACMGGNNICHCIHVKELIERVDRIEATSRTAAATFVPDPWSRNVGPTAPATLSGPSTGNIAAPNDTLPLKLTATLGAIGYKDRPIFDMKMSLQDDYKFNGSKDGFKWKGKVGSYFTTCAPVLMEVLKWAERQDNQPIKAETFA